MSDLFGEIRSCCAKRGGVFPSGWREDRHAVEYAKQLVAKQGLSLMPHHKGFVYTQFPIMEDQNPLFLCLGSPHRDNGYALTPSKCIIMGKVKCDAVSLCHREVHRYLRELGLESLRMTRRPTYRDIGLALRVLGESGHDSEEARRQLLANVSLRLWESFISGRPETRIG